MTVFSICYKNSIYIFNYQPGHSTKCSARVLFLKMGYPDRWYLQTRKERVQKESLLLLLAEVLQAFFDMCKLAMASFFLWLHKAIRYFWWLSGPMDASKPLVPRKYMGIPITQAMCDQHNQEVKRDNLFRVYLRTTVAVLAMCVITGLFRFIGFV